MKKFLIIVYIFLIISCSNINPAKELLNGIRLYNSDSLNESIKSFSKVISQNDTCHYCYLYRGFAYKNLNKLDLAEKDFSHLISIEKNNWEGYANRGSIYYLKKNYSNSLRDFQKALELDTTANMFYNPISHMLFITGKKEKACEFYHKALLNGDTVFDKQIIEYCNKK